MLSGAASSIWLTMAPRWNWDFGDEQPGRASCASSVEPAKQPPALEPARARAVRVRRRRAAVLLALAALAALLVAVIPGSHHARAASDAAVRLQRRAQALAAAQARRHVDPAAARRAAVNAVLAYTPFVKEGGDRGRDVALTFDDGPGPYTPGVLSVLERLHVHATFFEIGKMLQYFGVSTERELRDGDVIGDHTETHPMMALLHAHAQREQLFEQIARVELLGGPRPLLFRPPYGSYDATTMRELHKLRLLMVLWSVDTEDYLQPGVSTIVRNALAGAHPGAIILMHDAGGTRTQTIAALPTVIDALRRRGFRLVTVPELLREDPPPAGQTLPSSLSGD
jgi:peptidoglycan-N-acetylglucosamine deacetylase